MSAPTNEEQLLLEYINETRLDPLGSAARYIVSYSPLVGVPAVQGALTAFGVSGPALLAAFSSLVPVQPLAWSSKLGDAATGHSQILIATDSQTHQAPGEPDLGQRAINAGYTPFSGLGENVYAYASSALNAHAAFMVDWGFGLNGMQSPAGHRDNIMSGFYREVGLSAIAETVTTTSVGPLVVTEDFGKRFGGPQVFVLGVSYQDLDGNSFYSPGEGRGAMSVSASGVTGQTASSGGYSLELTAGPKTISFSGGGLPSSLTVTADLPDGTNAKLDVVNNSTLLSSVGLTLVSGVIKVAALGLQGLQFTGNASAQEMVGNAGNNLFKGLAGLDTLDGRAGSDTADYSEKTGALTVSLNGGVAVGVRVNGVLEDIVKNVENILGGSGNDTLIGDAHNNWFKGGGGRDGMDGGSGSDTADFSDLGGSIKVALSGAVVSTVYQNNVWEDRVKNIENIIGGTGNDTLVGDAQNNSFRGGGGRDGMDGGSGADTADFSDMNGAVSVTLAGASAVTVNQNGVWEDRIKNIENLIGGSGNDGFTGDLLANNLNGGAGNDTLNGALGNDTLTGEAGNDRFVFGSALGTTNIDTITDFQTTLDKIVLDDDIFTALGIAGTTAGVALTAAKFQLGTAANDAGDRIVYNQTTGQLFYDADGNGAAAQQQIALIGVSSHAAISAGDFLVVA